MPLILGAQSAVATGFNVENSCRFNDGDDAYLTRTFGTPTNGKIWTYSCWVKTSDISDTAPNSVRDLLGARIDSNNYSDLAFLSDERWMYILDYHTGAGGAYGKSIDVRTLNYYRDCGAWMHMVWACDTTQAVETNRMKFYVNGTQVTTLSANRYMDQDEELTVNKNTANCDVGRAGAGYYYFDGYMAEVAFIDGTQYAASDFGEFNEDSPTIWQPIDFAEDVTFGDNGFYLDFKDSADLGKDVSGEGNDLTPTNIAAVDQCEDSPTNNFTTLNYLNMPPSDPPTFSQGLTYVVTPNASSKYFGGTTTMGLSSGKWYWETYSVSALAAAVVGVYTDPNDAALNSRQPGYSTYDWAYEYDGTIISNNVDQDTGMGSWSSGDYIGTYLDLDNNKIYWALNGTIINSGTGWDITAAASTTHGFYYPGCADQETTSSTFAFNFGNGSFGAINLTGTVYADNDGYGIFKYSPNDGGSASFDSAAKNFMAICTKNLGKYGG